MLPLRLQPDHRLPSPPAAHPSSPELRKSPASSALGRCGRPFRAPLLGALKARYRSSGSGTRQLAALLAAALPGAILLCILHCVLPSHAHQHNSHGASPFVCNHSLATPGDLPPPLSATLVLGLVQGLARAGAPLTAGLIFLHLAATAHSGLRARLAEGPPVPPPRPAA